MGDYYSIMHKWSFPDVFSAMRMLDRMEYDMEQQKRMRNAQKGFSNG